MGTLISRVEGRRNNPLPSIFMSIVDGIASRTIRYFHFSTMHKLIPVGKSYVV